MIKKNYDLFYFDKSTDKMAGHKLRHSRNPTFTLMYSYQVFEKNLNFFIRCHHIIRFKLILSIRNFRFESDTAFRRSPDTADSNQPNWTVQFEHLALMPIIRAYHSATREISKFAWNP